ncbi:MAG: cation:proton antiporter domain-containing protein [Planctomycetota bacterium]
MGIVLAVPGTVSVAGGFVIAAGGGVDPLVRDIGFCLIVSAILCVVFTRLRIPSIAAFLVAGVIVGPQLGEIVTDKANIETIANLGLTLLLFVIGLEIDVKKLIARGKTLIITGLLQFPLCIAFGYAVALTLQATGWEIMQGSYLPLYVGFTVAASSTLIVIKLLQERFQLDTVVGRMALGMLIFQDIWAIVILAVQPKFQDPAIGPVILTFIGIGTVLLFSVLVAKYILPTAFNWIAKIPELMLVAALGWCFAVGSFGYNLDTLLGFIGIHLHIQVSMEMGALIAGATIAALPYSHEVVTKVIVVRDFFVTLFFVGLGMGIPAPNSFDVLLLALLLGTTAVLARFVIFFPLMYYAGLDRRNAMVSSTKLAQVSEFCLVIAYLGLGYEHIGSDMVSAVIFAFVITALATPLLFRIADPIHDRLGGVLRLLGFHPPPAKARDGAEDGSGALVILGFHRLASSILHEIERTRPDMLKEIMVVDFNVAIHPQIAATGANVKYGDISNKDALHHLGVDDAKVIVCTIPDDVLKGTSNLQLAKNLRHINPEAIIIINALEISAVKDMYEAGADYVFLSRIETARNILPALDAAIGGNLEEFKKEQESQFGPLDARHEVFP